MTHRRGRRGRACRAGKPRCGGGRRQHHCLFALFICAGKRRCERVLTFKNVSSQRYVAQKACVGAGAGRRKKSAPLKNFGGAQGVAYRRACCPALGDQGRTCIVKDAAERMRRCGHKPHCPACRVIPFFVVSLWLFCVRLLQAGHAACRRALSHNSCGPWAASLF